MTFRSDKNYLDLEIIRNFKNNTYKGGEIIDLLTKPIN